MEAARFWIIDNPLGGEPSLPEPASARDGEGPYVLPIVDEEYGGVIAWANTTEQAERIVAALALAESFPADSIQRIVAYNIVDEERDHAESVQAGDIEPLADSHIYTHLVRVDEWLTAAGVAA